MNINFNPQSNIARAIIEANAKEAIGLNNKVMLALKNADSKADAIARTMTFASLEKDASLVDKSVPAVQGRAAELFKANAAELELLAALTDSEAYLKEAEIEEKLV